MLARRHTCTVLIDTAYSVYNIGGHMSTTNHTTEQIIEEHVDALRHLVLDYQAKHGHIPDTVNFPLSVSEDTAAQPLALRLRTSGWVLVMQAHKPGESVIHMTFSTQGGIPS